MTKKFICMLALAIALSCASIATAVDIDFDLSDGVFIKNPPPDVSPPDAYHSNAIDLVPFGGPLMINPGETQEVWVKFNDMLHLDVRDDPPPGNSNGVERLRTHIAGQVLQAGNEADLWVDVILTGVSGHIRKSFEDPSGTHDRKPLNTGDNPDLPPIDRNDPPTGQQIPPPRNDLPVGDWDGADDGSGTDVWDLFHQDVLIDREKHFVANAFVLETWADDLTDDNYLYHDIHWAITNEGDVPVEITSVEFWQEGNVVQRGVWVPEPSALIMAVFGVLGLSSLRRYGNFARN